jgi:mannose-6-phosphate isomerase-like protein (cupin superfamily)
MKKNEPKITPWGYYTKLLHEKIRGLNQYIWIKKVTIRRKQRISLQKHACRSEKWFVLSGKGVATLNNNVAPIAAGSLIDVPKQAPHRLQNTGKCNLILIEIAMGSVVNEDDIIRIEDDYGRVIKTSALIKNRLDK